MLKITQKFELSDLTPIWHYKIFEIKWIYFSKLNQYVFVKTLNHHLGSRTVTLFVSGFIPKMHLLQQKPSIQFEIETKASFECCIFIQSKIFF